MKIVLLTVVAVTAFGSAIAVRKINIVKRKDVLTSLGAASVLVCIVADAIKGDFAVILLRDGCIVEPAVEIIARLNWVVASNVGCEDIVIGCPCVSGISVGRYRKPIAAKSILNYPLKGAGGPVLANSPFELAVFVGTIVLTLVPVADRDGNSLWVAKRGNFPRRWNPVLMLNAFE